MQTGEQSEGDAEADRDQHRRQCEFQRCRHALEDQVDRRHAGGEGNAEVAAKGAAKKQPVLFPQRPVKTEQRGGAGDFRLIGLRVDQQIHRVADGVDPGKHQQ